MKAALVSLVFLGLAAACGTPAPPTVTATDQPSQVAAVPSPTVHCEDLSEAQCRAATDATLTVLAEQDANPASIVIQPGIVYADGGYMAMCNDSTCPAWGSPRPDGGRYIANALVGYVGSNDSGFFNIYTKDGVTTAVFIARVPHAPEGSQPDPGPS